MSARRRVRGGRSHAVNQAVRGFGDDQCTDVAAGLTYYAVLAVFPAAVALVSLLGVIGQAQSSVNTVLDVLRPLVSPQTLDNVRTALTDVSTSPGAGIGLVVGLLGALWSASAYVGAFGRAMNRVYGVEEGRPFWKLRPAMLVVTLLATVMVAAMLVLLVVSGSLADSLGAKLGLGSQALLVWRIARWPVLALLAAAVIALLYRATPNVRQPGRRFLSAGALTAIVVWAAASVGFAFYVARFSSYNRTYGSLAGVVVSLLFVWIANLALLFGAELDCELERSRELRAGLPAERALQLAPRDTRTIKKAHRRRRKEVEHAQAIRADVAREHDRAEEQTTQYTSRDYEEATR